ncbi:MAG: DUF5715 family protein [Acidobacteriota bacterium]
MKPFHLLLGLLLLPGAATPIEGQSLKPSRSSLNSQNHQARDHDFTFLRNPAQVARFVERGWLVPITGNRDYRLDGVSFPYGRPEVRLFVERLSRQYRAACGEPLTVTSLTRPRSHQPWNASPRSVHPTGMALDLRRSRSRDCRRWLERTLLYLEGQKVLEATRERWPPHYHLAIFPRPYRQYVAGLRNRGDAKTYRVASGDTLWKIARKHRTEVEVLRRLNDLDSNRIFPGQMLKVPSDD